MLFLFGLHSSLSRVEEGWLKIPPKRKFRESAKTGNEEKEFLEKSVPKSTRYVIKWSFISFALWQNARPNKEEDLNEEVGFHVERDKIQGLDRNIRDLKIRGRDGLGRR